MTEKQKKTKRVFYLADFSKTAPRFKTPKTDTYLHSSINSSEVIQLLKNPALQKLANNPRFQHLKQFIEDHK